LLISGLKIIKFVWMQQQKSKFSSYKSMKIARKN